MAASGGVAWNSWLEAQKRGALARDLPSEPILSRWPQSRSSLDPRMVQWGGSAKKKTSEALRRGLETAQQGKVRGDDCIQDGWRNLRRWTRTG
ncbi:hypothetical protein NDU88_003945 [Pleurodeles waltl]|uniref:Uncharacterized protein n=1 Tax=Pleurodeles waltl TaxID=8319 RepID=A0AAV7SHH9_PLEWA|nr:hypothetical protein NDU88_003945 [Pleurodeles waltl]